MWLQDFLPDDISNARIMVYGYNTSLQGYSDYNRMSDYRRNLVQQLELVRNSEEVLSWSLPIDMEPIVLILSKKKRRPIVFLGHSLGGILILQVGELDRCCMSEQS